MAENIPNPIPTDLEERFWARVDVRGQDECWVWTGHTPRRGYGILHIWKTRRNLRAHRLSYAIHSGPIPDGMLICHKCDNPSCVNPAHLFVGTDLDNNRDRDRKGRGKYHFQSRPEMRRYKGHEQVQSKLTFEQVIALRQDKRGSFDLAKEYGIDPSTVRRIKRGDAYKNVPMGSVS